MSRIDKLAKLQGLWAFSKYTSEEMERLFPDENNVADSISRVAVLNCEPNGADESSGPNGLKPQPIAAGEEDHYVEPCSCGLWNCKICRPSPADPPIEKERDDGTVDADNDSGLRDGGVRGPINAPIEKLSQAVSNIADSYDLDGGPERETLWQAAAALRSLAGENAAKNKVLRALQDVNQRLAQERDAANGQLAAKDEEIKGLHEDNGWCASEIARLEGIIQAIKATPIQVLHSTKPLPDDNT